MSTGCASDGSRTCTSSIPNCEVRAHDDPCHEHTRRQLFRTNPKDSQRHNGLTLQIVGMTLLGTDVRRQIERVGQALTVAQRQGNEAIALGWVWYLLSRYPRVTSS